MTFQDMVDRGFRQKVILSFCKTDSSWENGYNESFNGRLRDEFLNGEIFHTLTESRVLIEDWRKHYNHIRPHSSLGYRPPAPEAIVSPDPHSAALHADHGLQGQWMN